MTTYAAPHALLLGATTISQISDVSPNTNIGHFMDKGAGEVAPQFLGANTILPDIGFRTRQIKSLLGLCGSGNEYVCADLSGGNVDLYYRTRKFAGLREADNATVHLRARCEANAFLAWNEITASQGQEAEVSAIIKPVDNGVNLPLAWTGGVPIAGAQTAAEQYALGAIKLNGSWITQVDSMNWSNNLSLDEVQHAGRGMLHFVAVDQFAPVVKIRTRDLDYVASLGNGTAVTALSVFLRRRLGAGVNVPDATTSHFRLVATSGKASTGGVSGAPGVAEITIQLSRPSGGGAVFTPTADVAIA